MNPIVIFMVATLTVTSAQFLREKERDDGSFDIGSNFQSSGSPAQSVYAYLTKGSGWTGFSRNLREELKRAEQKQENEVTSVQPRQSFEGSIFATKLPFAEILRALEAFIRLKGEIASRLSALWYDNREIISQVTRTLIGKLGLLHGFTLNGIILLRKVLEFAGQLFGNWNVNVDVANTSG